MRLSRDDAVAEQRVRVECERTVRPAIDGNLVRDALAQLSDLHRAMIYRSYYLGRTTTQIAAELRTNDDAVKDELHHALHALRMTLQSAGRPTFAVGTDRADTYRPTRQRP